MFDSGGILLDGGQVEYVVSLAHFHLLAVFFSEESSPFLSLRHSAQFSSSSSKSSAKSLSSSLLIFSHPSPLLPPAMTPISLPFSAFGGRRGRALKPRR